MKTNSLRSEITLTHAVVCALQLDDAGARAATGLVLLRSLNAGDVFKITDIEKLRKSLRWGAYTADNCPPSWRNACRKALEKLEER